MKLRLVLWIISFSLSVLCNDRMKILQDQFISSSQPQSLRAGVAKIDGSLPIGIPLAGFNHGQRRVPYWPIPDPTPYTTWMTPSTGIMDPTWVKALVLDNGVTQVAFITFDAIGCDGNLNQIVYNMAVDQGFNISYENCLFSSSHSHSGPGAIADAFLWSIAPATDLLVPELQQAFAASAASAMVQAFQSLAPAKIDIGMGSLINVTQNRRARISPYVRSGTIDPHLGVIRVDDANGDALATVWNFAIHGVCYGPENLMASGDIMGKACEMIEDLVGGVALFINGDAGDIDPTSHSCKNAPDFFGSSTMASAVDKVRSSLTPTDQVAIQAYTNVVQFGPTDLNATLGRFDNCTAGGPLDICTICSVLRCDLNAHLYSSWIEQSPRFTAFSFLVYDTKTVVVSMPGEALVELGWWVRNDTLDMGFDQTLLAGYSNSHMGYFATPDEYDVGGYESQLTFWGITTAAQVRAGAKAAAEAVIPQI